jgi:hypothetical protein
MIPPPLDEIISFWYGLVVRGKSEEVEEVLKPYQQ